MKHLLGKVDLEVAVLLGLSAGEMDGIVEGAWLEAGLEEGATGVEVGLTEAEAGEKEGMDEGEEVVEARGVEVGLEAATGEVEGVVLDEATKGDELADATEVGLEEAGIMEEVGLEEGIEEVEGVGVIVGIGRGEMAGVVEELGLTGDTEEVGVVLAEEVELALGTGKDELELLDEGIDDELGEVLEDDEGVTEGVAEGLEEGLFEGEDEAEELALGLGEGTAGVLEGVTEGEAEGTVTGPEIAKVIVTGLAALLQADIDQYPPGYRS